MSRNPPRAPAPGTPPREPGDAALSPVPGPRLLEARLVRMENYLGFRPLTEAEAEAILNRGGAAPPAAPAAVDDGLEMEIGEFWLARVGVLALIVGLAFLVAYPFEALPAVVSCLIGYAAAAVFFAAARRWQSSLPETSHILFGGALFLLFFATLRLHFFSAHPVVAGRGMGLALLVVVLGVEFQLAVRRRSELMAGLVLGLGMVAGLVSDHAAFQLWLLVVLACVSYVLVRRHGWPWFSFASTVLPFAMHLDWLLGHPLLGRAPHGVEEGEGNLLALAGYAVPLLALGCRPKAGDDHVALRIGRALVISGGVMLVTLINVQLFPASLAPSAELAASAGLLLAAFVYWRHHRSTFATSIHACGGYLLLSAAIIRHFPAPGFYAWLAWQSLLVAVTAVGFQSRIIVVANLFIYAGIYVLYLFFGTVAGAVNLSFAAVALLTARVLHWQKDSLGLRTELMRTIYLGAATIVIPYGLLHTVPPRWVSVAWLGAACLYFAASAILRSDRYRWMGIATILAAVVHVFVVDLARLEPAYRIMSFLVLGVVLLGISIAYAWRRRKAAGAR